MHTRSWYQVTYIKSIQQLCIHSSFTQLTQCYSLKSILLGMCKFNNVFNSGVRFKWCNITYRIILLQPNELEIKGLHRCNEDALKLKQIRPVKCKHRWNNKKKKLKFIAIDQASLCAEINTDILSRSGGSRTFLPLRIEHRTQIARAVDGAIIKPPKQQGAKTKWCGSVVSGLMTRTIDAFC